MEQIRKLLEAAIVASPYGRLLGLQCEEVEEDRVCVRLPYRADVTTVGNMVHGGAISSLADVVATAACWASPRVAPGSRGTTIALSLQFLNAGRGQDLVATAQVIQRGRSVCVAEVTVEGSDGTLVARASATYKLSAPDDARKAAPKAAAEQTASPS